MSHFDFRRLGELNPGDKCDPRAILPLGNGTLAVGTLDGFFELYDEVNKVFRSCYL